MNEFKHINERERKLYVIMLEETFFWKYVHKKRNFESVWCSENSSIQFLVLVS